MTSRYIYEAVLIELNKVNAPSLLLGDFNYFANKAIQQIINKKYNIYDVNQQTTDDLRVLKSTTELTPKEVKPGVYEAYLPSDYLHLLNCLCEFDINKCNTQTVYGAIRATSDSWPIIISNYYQRPSYKRPYYFIHNVNTSSELPTNPYIPDQVINNGLGTGTDCLRSEEFEKGATKIQDKVKRVLDTKSSYEIKEGKYVINKEGGGYNYLIAGIDYESNPVYAWTSNDELVSKFGFPANTTITTYYKFNNSVIINDQIDTSSAKKVLANSSSINKQSSNLATSINLAGSSVSLINKTAAYRYGNASAVRLEIRCGSDKLTKIYVDYLKSPQYIELTPVELDLTEDTSQIIEYPDYVCQEIINELVHIVMENVGDPRLQTHVPVSQSIASPAQQQTAQPSA